MRCIAGAYGDQRSVEGAAKLVSDAWYMIASVLIGLEPRSHPTERKAVAEGHPGIALMDVEK